jgi:probable rRNA maturation factor
MLYIQNLTKARIDKKFLEKAAEKTLKIAGVKKKAEISLVIVSNKRIKELNKKYRGIDQATDVLSFSQMETPLKNSKAKPELQNPKMEFIEPPDKILHLGEIFISYQKAKTQAIQHQQIIQKEITFLFIHGILHLLGYGHTGKNEAKEMQKLEEKILFSLFNLKTKP